MNLELKIYVVISRIDYSPSTVEGVFFDKAKAKACAWTAVHEAGNDDCDIEEWVGGVKKSEESFRSPRKTLRKSQT